MTSRDNTNKKNIINKICNKIGLSSNYSANLIDDLISILILKIVEDKSFKIKNFGAFNLRKKNKRVGRNPKNKINYEILERNVVVFKAAEKLIRKLNNHVKK